MMTGKTMYQLALGVLLGRHEEVLHVDELKRLIMRELSSSAPGIIRYLKMMEETGLTKEIEPFKYQINLK